MLLTCYSTQKNPNSENTSHLIAVPVVIVFKKMIQFDKHSSGAKLAQIRFSFTCHISHRSVFFQLILLSLINRVKKIFQSVVCKVQDSSFLIGPAVFLDCVLKCAIQHCSICTFFDVLGGNAWKLLNIIFHSVTGNEFYLVSSSKHIANISQFSSCLCCSWGGRYSLQKRKILMFQFLMKYRTTMTEVLDSSTQSNQEDNLTKATVSCYFNLE